MQHSLQAEHNKNDYSRYENKQTKWIQLQLPEYYQIQGIGKNIFMLVGKGGYGQVLSAYDNRLPQNERQKNKVAIKIMTNVFDGKLFTKRILRQLKLLRLLKHPNIIDIKTIILPKSRKQMNYLFVVFQLMDQDLYTTIRKGQALITQAHCQQLVYQILRGLLYIHSAGILHRDMKTRNLLINEQCNLKICDFGLSRLKMNQEEQNPMTEYVVTRWYRPPQIILGDINYTPAVDVWGVGCIMAEILTKKTLLIGRTSEQQLELICSITQKPDMKWLKQNYETHYEFISKIYYKKSKENKMNLFDEKFDHISLQGQQLLRSMLTFQPSKRITVQQALKSPYFGSVIQYKPELFQESKLNKKIQQTPIIREPQSQIKRQQINPLQFQFQNYDLSAQQLKDIMYEQILLYHFPDFAKQYTDKLAQNKSVIDHIVKNSSKNSSKKRQKN